MDASGMLLPGRVASSRCFDGLIIGACSGKPPAARSMRGTAVLRRPFVLLSAWWSKDRSRPFSFSSASRRFDSEWVEYPTIIRATMGKATASRAGMLHSRQAPQCPLSGRVHRRSDNRIPVPPSGERFLKNSIR